MTDAQTPSSGTAFERLTIGLEHAPWSAIYRAVLAFLALAVVASVAGNDVSALALVPALLFLLLGLRIGPAVLRRLLQRTVLMTTSQNPNFPIKLVRRLMICQGILKLTCDACNVIYPRD